MRTGGCCCTCKGSRSALENFNEDHKLHLHAAILKEHMEIQRATALPKQRNNNARKSPSNRTHLDKQTTMEYLRNLGDNCKKHVTSTQPLHERIHSSCADQTFKEIIHIPHSATPNQKFDENQEWLHLEARLNTNQLVITNYTFCPTFNPHWKISYNIQRAQVGTKRVVHTHSRMYNLQKGSQLKPT